MASKGLALGTVGSTGREKCGWGQGGAQAEGFGHYPLSIRTLLTSFEEGIGLERGFSSKVTWNWETF